MMNTVKKPRQNLHGILLLDKPLGVSSAQALAKAKWLLNANKAGHTGTLDPLADGLLPLCFGHATKLAHDLLDADKTYLATLHLGQTTTTGDKEGQVLKQRDAVITRSQWDAILPQFVGEIAQVPPMYSALKKDGKPLYELAREGIEVERAARNVVIHRLETVSFDYPQVVIKVCVSKGTYIRTLAEDMGEALQVGAHLTGLRRIAVGDLVIEQAVTIEAIEAMAQEERVGCLLPLDTLLQSVPAVHLESSEALRFKQGQRLKVPLADVETLRVYGQAQLIGLASVAGNTLSPKIVLVEQA